MGPGLQNMDILNWSIYGAEGKGTEAVSALIGKGNEMGFDQQGKAHATGGR